MPHNLPRGVTRGPDGKFRSEDGAGFTWHDTDLISGWRAAEIPAADLSGQSQDRIDQEGNSTEIIDFSGLLENDEVFEVVTMWVEVLTTAHTTASAEGYVQAKGIIGSNVPDSGWWLANDPFFGNTDVEDGTVDVATFTDDQDDSRLFQYVTEAEPSFGDSTNGLGAGSLYDRIRKMVPLRSLYGTGPVYDQDDEIYAPVVFDVDNVDDHAVSNKVAIALRGIIHQV